MRYNTYKFNKMINDYLTLSTIGIDTCDSISIVLSDFNSMGSLARETHTNTNINWKELVNYWLYGTATEINWFDKYSHIGWDYLKDGCNINRSITLDYDNLYNSEN